MCNLPLFGNFNKQFILLISLFLVCGICTKIYKKDGDSRTIMVVTNQDEVNMVLLGDWGGMESPPYKTPFEEVTAKQIMKTANMHQTDFLLALGDNFYYHGVTNEYDQRFKSTFENVFNEPSFQEVPWFVVAGNHDHYGNVTGQIEYSKHSQRWYFPDLWYTIKIRTNTYNASIIMIDTVTLCGNTQHDVHADQPDFDTTNQHASNQQLQYIEQQLQNNRDSYIFVAGHFPVYSIAEHGPTQCLLDILKPLLEKYQVSAYFCGHDHNLQHIRDDEESKVEYFVSGAGDMINPSLKNIDSIPKGSLKFHSASFLSLGGFATLNVQKDGANFQFHTGVGSVDYKYEFQPRK